MDMRPRVTRAMRPGQRKRLPAFTREAYAVTACPTLNDIGEASMANEQAHRHTTNVDVALLVLRLALGTIFIAHGAQKLFGWFGGGGLGQTITAFQGMGIPPFLTVLVAIVEFFGGVAVLIGLLSRLASLALAVNMLVAMILVHAPNGFFLGEQPGIEFVLALFAMSVAVFTAGPGEIAVVRPEPGFRRRSRVYA